MAIVNTYKNSDFSRYLCVEECLKIYFEDPLEQLVLITLSSLSISDSEIYFLHWHEKLSFRKDAKDIEGKAHEYFKSKRATGEWFRLDKDIAVSTIQDFMAVQP